MLCPLERFKKMEKFLETPLKSFMREDGKRVWEHIFIFPNQIKPFPFHFLFPPRGAFDTSAILWQKMFTNLTFSDPSCVGYHCESFWYCVLLVFDYIYIKLLNFILNKHLIFLYYYNNLRLINLMLILMNYLQGI